MSSITRHHAEWLSLLEISGPFLSMPVLLQAFPQGLDAHDPELSQLLKAAHEEWADNQSGLRPDSAIHTAWVRYVLEQALGYNEEILLEGQSIPNSLKADIPEHGITLRPDLVLVAPLPSDDGSAAKKRQGTRAVKLLIKIYPPTQELDKPVSGWHWKASVETQMMGLLHATDVKLGLATNGEQWMLVHAPRGETTGFISWYAHLWFDEPLTLRAFRSLLGVMRFFGVPDEETLESLLAKSAQDQQEVTDQLGYQVRNAVEILIGNLDKADLDRGRTLLSGVSEERLYEAALTVMMRLVFLLSAEERRLLPLDDPFYAENYAISTLRAQLREIADQYGEDLLERRTDAWNRLLATFRAVYGGVRHDRLTLIAYGGSLFDPDRFPFLEGRPEETAWMDTPADPLPVDNRTVLHLLDALQILQVPVPGGGPAEARRLSFRALDIEQIGHVYEGLLDHVAVRAAEPVLGLVGTKDKEPEISLPELEEQFSKGLDAFVDYLKSETGRSAGALKNGLGAELDAFRAQRLRAACGNDEALLKRVLPFLGLLRDDDSGFPVIIPAGSVYVTAGPTRRATGTHYTPRSLTEPIVRHTLEPQVYEGPAEGWAKEKWALRSPKHILDLKVCDMAMGSGAFLVQACRYLSERLVEAWENSERDIKERSGLKQMLLTPEGLLVDNPDQAIPSGTEDRLALARRLVADRCLYGVDKNPLAVEMSKLSLWLVTLDKNRPFTFLNHALKCGDSLVGASEDDFLRWAHSDLSPQGSLFDEFLQKQLETAREKRRQLQSFQVLDVRDAERKARLLEKADEAMDRIKLGCDLITGVKLLGLNQTEQDDMLVGFLLDYVAGDSMEELNAIRAFHSSRKERTFHWEFEFPEVFENGGYDALVGNPPFLGGKRISTFYGDFYRKTIDSLFPESNPNADISAKFHLKASILLRGNGSYGLLATDRISEGDTKAGGLDIITHMGNVIYRAEKSNAWPGVASVRYSLVHIYKGQFEKPYYLDGEAEDHISTTLTSSTSRGEPRKLNTSWGTSFVGVAIQGAGFILDQREAFYLIQKNPQNNEIIRPFLTANDLNHTPDTSPRRWIINFEDRDLKSALFYPELLQIVRERVKPHRDVVKRKAHRERWWQFGDWRPGLVKYCSNIEKVIVCAMTTVEFKFAWVPSTWVFDQTVIVIIPNKIGCYSILESSIHKSWAYEYGSSFGSGGAPRYNPSRCFKTYPFPKLNSPIQLKLQELGEQLHNFRSGVMTTRQIGLTSIYNHIHDPMETADDIARLRKLHVEMDEAVASAYSWDDLDLDHDFYETPQGLRFTISEEARCEVLRRLQEINYQRYQEEVAQGMRKKGGRGKGKVRKLTRPPSQKRKKIAEVQPAYKAEGSKQSSSKPKPEPTKDQTSFLGMVDEAVPELLTRMPFIGLSENIYRSPMPFGKYDPEGHAYEEMKAKGVHTIVMLVSDGEAQMNTLHDLHAMYQKDGFDVIQYPIPDFGVPERDALDKVVDEVITRARDGQNIAVHCSAGVGRTGLFMAEIAKKVMKMSGSSALYWVRLYIPGAVETPEQERFVVEG